MICLLYVAIRYRASSAKGEEPGLSYRTGETPEYDIDMCCYDSVRTDGEWHTTIFYMAGEPGRNGANFILNLCLIPFYRAEDFARETFDIARIKFYRNDPTEVFEADFYVPGEDEPDASGEETTEAPGEGSGCASVVGFGAVAALMAAAAAVALRKKED